MSDIEIKIDPKQLNEIGELLAAIPREIPKIMRSALNTTAAQARTQIVKRLSTMVKLKDSVLRDAIKLTRASTTRWLARIDVHGKRIPLIYFGARQIAFGVTYRISDMMGAGFLRHAFIQTMKKGEGVWMRFQRKDAFQTFWTKKWKARRSHKIGALVSDIIAKGKGGKFTGTEGELVPRFPVYFLRGPSPGALVDSIPGYGELVAMYAGYNLERNIDEQLERVLAKMKTAAEANAA